MSGSFTVPTVRISFDTVGRTLEQRPVPIEAPLEIAFGTVPYAVMMVTPIDLEDFVTGFALSEGVIERLTDLREIIIEPHPKGYRASVHLEPQQLSAHLARRRAMAGRTGCGVCGIEDLQSLPEATKQLTPPASEITIPALKRAVSTLSSHQPLNGLTRAVHAAAWFDQDGEILIAREDVGRHNALDKLIGAMLSQKLRPDSGFLVITSRCSYEMVEKAAIAGISTLVAVSAPTSLAIERATALGLRLYAIARADSTLQFTNIETDQMMLEKCA